MSEKKPYHQKIAEEIIAKIEAGTAPWQKPWEPGIQAPYNPTTGKEYRGINSLILMMRQDDDPRWMTYKQAKDIGAHVKAGEKSSTMQYWQFREERAVRDSDGKIIKDESGQALKTYLELERPRVFYANVFNGSQIEGLPPLEKKQEKIFEIIEDAEKIIADTGAKINHSSSDSAFYSIINDDIHLPLKEQFKDEISYYHTAFHELGHWTGHESRLNRDISNPFGSEAYAKEELRAEIASVIVGIKVGIGFEPQESNAAYVKNWVEVLKNDPLEIFRAAADADKIKEYIINPLSRKQEMEQQTQQKIGDDAAVSQSDKKNMSIENNAGPTEKIFIHVRYDEKDQAKALGAKWDAKKRSWFIPPGVDREPFKKWEQTEKKSTQEKNQEDAKDYISVPYKNRHEAKALGAKWDAKEKSWFIPPGVDREPFKKWEQTSIRDIQDPAMEPRTEFAKLMESMKFNVSGDHPIMDGKTHRIEVDGDIKGNKSGFYVVHSDGRPAGYLKNNRTGEECNWKYSGYSMTERDKSVLKENAAEKQKKRQQETLKRQEEAAERVKKQIGPDGDFRKIDSKEDRTPYHETKGIDATKGTYIKDKILCIPAHDIDGKIRTAKYIQDDGTKLFASGGKKMGCFHIIGGGPEKLNELKTAEIAIVAEGYSTAATIDQCGLKNPVPVIAAFDSGNLQPVVESIKERFPKIEIIIAADDDRHLQKRDGIFKNEWADEIRPGNIGIEKGKAAAAAVGGKMISPKFAVGEQISSPRDFKDFNDLARNSKLKDAVRKQIQAAVNDVNKKIKETKQAKLKPEKKRALSMA